MSRDHAIALLLLDAALLLVLGRCLGGLLTTIGQPHVLGEILAGVLVGASLLGLVAPGVQAALFPDDVMALLVGVGNVGLVVFVFLVGLGIDGTIVRRRLRQVAKISGASLAVPFAAGVLIALPLYGRHLPANDAIGRLPFVLFIGTALSVTAFPVLARIVSAQRLDRSTLGTMALTAAAMLDLAGWIMLATVLTLVAGEGGDDLAWTLLEGLSFALFVVKVGAPLLVALLSRLSRGSGAAAEVPVLAAAVLACAGATQLIGLHSVLGALLLGFALPRERASELLAPLRRELTSAGAVLLPIYFAVAGMSVDLASFDGGNLLELGVLLVVATATKVGGTMAGARWAGFTWRDGLPFGVLMNTRGLIEVVVLNIGLGAGLLTSALYSELMVVALVATFMTTPTVRWLRTRSSASLWREASRGVEAELGAGRVAPKAAG